LTMPTTGITALLEQATARYQSQVNEAGPYLVRRGIDREVAEAARLGVVVEPEPGHEDYQGRLCIPYLTRAGVVTLKFRCIDPHDGTCKDNGHVKYLCPSGMGKPRLYNVDSFFSRSRVIAIAEGELDALILTHKAGIPAVGCPGVSTWQPHFPRCFNGFQQVLIFADGDQPGRDMARMITKELPMFTRTIQMPDGMDVNDVYLAEGREGLRQRAGLE
jgi:hypothetical protein